MSPEYNFLIKAAHGHFALKIITVYGFPDEPSGYGGYDTESYVEIQTHNYNAKGRINVSTDDIYQFYLQLRDCYKSVSGHAELISCEGNLSLDISFDDLGHIMISGKFIANTSFNNELIFELNGDQSYLPETINSLKMIVDTYGDQNRKKNSTETLPKKGQLSKEQKYSMKKILRIALGHL